MAKTISYGDYLKVEGLMVLARRNYKENEGVESALAEILSDNPDREDDYDCWSDWMYDDKPVKQLLKKLNVRVIGKKKT